MDSIVTPRIIIFGMILFVGVWLPLLFAHFSRHSELRLSSRAVVVLAVGLWAIPVGRYLADRLKEEPSAGVKLTIEATSHSPLYELSPWMSTWIGEPLGMVIIGLGLGTIGFILYEILHTWVHTGVPSTNHNER